MKALPLQGLKVLDLSRILAGPYATQILGDLGAHVLKIESPRGDDTRSWGPPFIERDGHSSAAYYFSANRNKKSLCVDLKNPTDLNHLKELIKESDVLVENFKVGGLKKFGLDYDSCVSICPQLIYCSINGFGSSGPDQDLPGYDALIQAMGGLMSVTGTSSGEPVRTGVAITDISTGLYAVIAIQAALLERSQSGLGQHIELSLFETQVSWLANVGMNFLTTRETPKKYGTAHPNIVPYQCFQAQDAPFYLAVGNDSQFLKLAELLDLDLEKKEKYRTNASRVEHRSEIIALLEEKFRKRPRVEWQKELRAQGIPIGPINSLNDLACDPQLSHLGTFGTMSDSDVPCIKSPMRFSRTPIRDYKTPPLDPSREKLNFGDFDE